MRANPRAEKIEVLEIAIDAIHGRGFEMNAPTDTPYYTFSYYNCPIVVLDSSGCREWPAGVSLLHAPNDPRYLRAESADLLNTWFHFAGPGVPACLAEYEIPINTVVDLGELPFLRPILEEVRQERIQQPLHWEDAVSDLIRRLFREFGALKSDLDNSLTPAQRTQERTLRDIRMQVHADMAHEWTVPEMAALGNWHPTWFATVYTRQFGVSPMNDLLNVRLAHAEALLVHLPMTVSHIAASCGFANVEHFNRLFRKRKGCTPSQIRKQGKR
ncbi:hypothetical protein CCAX7_40850 [Capsulimonas corticalis]|uniref:Uncharacterized protein n=1 Tax=Capsulimonas corticalis TaxID=2219043 RepID=A0A402D6E6_9BACT|nr:AraC family transcriptional regulator [Capsulimonas corticalis]BDI32034.1 hypothetical protein CCAX7_40850 [Capsulimonas corticalis]